MSKTIRKKTPGKPAKPRPDFPLFAHAAGVWAKKIKGKLHYFGAWSDPAAALTRYLNEKDAIQAGRTPRPKVDELTLRELIDRFMVGKRNRLDSGEITPKHYAELYTTCRKVGDSFGMERPVADLAADDFDRLRKQLARASGPVRLGNEVSRVRQIFKFGAESGLCALPVFGPLFKPPSRKVMRLNRAKKGPRMFQADELRLIIDKAAVPLKAMILLAANCGFGNNDVANLPTSAVDLKTGWVDFPRPKTGIPRRCPLWPETVAAIQAAIAKRPTHKQSQDADILFITKYGHRWQRTGVSNPDSETHKVSVTNNAPVSQEFIKVLKDAGLKRPGLGFYTLRHVFQTIGDGAKDPTATRSIMGHADESMSAAYREGIGDDRLQAVVDHVRAWLFPVEKKKAK